MRQSAAEADATQPPVVARADVAVLLDQLTLGPAAFTITAFYPASAPLIVTGEAKIDAGAGSFKVI